MVKRATLLVAICVLLSLAVPVLAIAQDTSTWSTDSSVNNLLCKGGYYGMATADDGSGGVIIAWAQTSYSGAFRGKYAGVGDTFDGTNFIAQKGE